jgi:hypothetical protein
VFNRVGSNSRPRLKFTYTSNFPKFTPSDQYRSILRTVYPVLHCTFFIRFMRDSLSRSYPRRPSADTSVTRGHAGPCTDRLSSKTAMAMPQAARLRVRPERCANKDSATRGRRRFRQGIRDSCRPNGSTCSYREPQGYLRGLSESHESHALLAECSTALWIRHERIYKNTFVSPYVLELYRAGRHWVTFQKEGGNP